MAALDQDLWADPQSLVNLGIDDITIDVAIRAVVDASWLLWALSGRQLHTAGEKVDVFEFPAGGSYTWYLHSTPVSAVESVIWEDPWTPESERTLDTSEYIVIGSKIKLRRSGGGSTVAGWYMGSPREMGTEALITVNYSVKSNLPFGTEGVVTRLAGEIAKASLGLPNGLPERIQNITRQGVSWTLITPDSFLDRGRTGIMYVDQWLYAVNPTRSAQKSKLFKPGAPKLVSSTWQDIIGSALFSVLSSDGARTYMGHGPPTDTDIPGHQLGDRYIDLDTGTIYNTTS